MSINYYSIDNNYFNYKINHYKGKKVVKDNSSSSKIQL